MKLIIDIEPRYCKDMESDVKELYYEAINRITEAVRNGKPYDNYEYIEGYKQTNLKTVRPPQYWLWDDTGHFYCPRCKKYPDYQIRLMNFCPNCGCDLRGEM